MQTAQVIFESRNGRANERDGWLDYCREQAPSVDEAEMWAREECKALAKRIGIETRYRIEIWKD